MFTSGAADVLSRKDCCIPSKNDALGTAHATAPTPKGGVKRRAGTAGPTSTARWDAETLPLRRAGTASPTSAARWDADPTSAARWGQRALPLRRAGDSEPYLYGALGRGDPTSAAHWGQRALPLRRAATAGPMIILWRGFLDRKIYIFCYLLTVCYYELLNY